MTREEAYLRDIDQKLGRIKEVLERIEGLLRQVVSNTAKTEVTFSPIFSTGPTCTCGQTGAIAPCPLHE